MCTVVNEATADGEAVLGLSIAPVRPAKVMCFALSIVDKTTGE